MDKRLTRYLWQDGDLHEALCVRCGFLRQGAVCDAYPDGIPNPILLGEHDHREPYPGDHGIRFEPIKAADES